MANPSKVVLTNNTRRPIPVANGIEVPAMGSCEVDAAFAATHLVDKYVARGDMTRAPVADSGSQPTPPSVPAKSPKK